MSSEFLVLVLISFAIFISVAGFGTILHFLCRCFIWPDIQAYRRKIKLKENPLNIKETTASYPSDLEKIELLPFAGIPFNLTIQNEVSLWDPSVFMRAFGESVHRCGGLLNVEKYIFSINCVINCVKISPKNDPTRCNFTVCADLYLVDSVGDVFFSINPSCGGRTYEEVADLLVSYLPRLVPLNVTNSMLGPTARFLNSEYRYVDQERANNIAYQLS